GVVGSSRQATVSQMRSASPGNGSCRVSSQRWKRTEAIRSSQRRKLAGSSLATYRAAWSYTLRAIGPPPCECPLRPPLRHTARRLRSLRSLRLRPLASAGVRSPLPALLSDGNSGETEAEVVAPVRRPVPEAVRRQAVNAVVEPAAAPVHPARAPLK